MSALTPEHRAMLEAAAIAADVIEEAGVYSVADPGQVPQAMPFLDVEGMFPGLVFPLRTLSGMVVAQYRPDRPPELADGTTVPKYVFPQGLTVGMFTLPRMAERLADTSAPLVIVEGTKQYLAAVSSAGPGMAVVGMAGCWGFSTDGVPDPDLARLPLAGRKVVVLLDADVRTNRNVHDAGTRLAEHLALLGGSLVCFATVPASGSVGIDDYLATIPAELRAQVLASLVESARPLSKRAPARKRSAEEPEGSRRFFDDGGLKVAALVDAALEEHHLALGIDGRIVVYRDGCYRTDPNLLVGALVDLLGDQYRPMHRNAFEDVCAARLARDGRCIAEVGERLISVANGLLDPLTGELHPHTPAHLSTAQLRIGWDAEAPSPIFDDWLARTVEEDVAPYLLEDAAQLLDRRPGRQRKALFLYGPTRSGKSTFIRLLEALVGPDARSAVTLHDLAGDRFAAADLAGAVLNAAADLSAAHVEDLSLFKQLQGDDPVRAQKKYGQPFTFRNTALFVFSANTVPTVAEVSRAYLARIRPYRFPHSFEGYEDPDLEARLLAELPGILVRLVEGYQRHAERGGYAENDAVRRTLDDFARQSDRVRLFLAETCEEDDGAFISRTSLFGIFETWCRVNQRRTLGRHRFFESVAQAGYRAVTRNGTRGFLGLTERPEDEWGIDDTPARVQKVQLSPSPVIGGTNEREEEGGESRYVRGGKAEPAPSAPSADDLDPDEIIEEVVA